MSSFSNYSSGPNFKHISVDSLGEGLFEVKMNRPEKRNAMNTKMWREIGQCFTEVIPHDSSCRCVLLTGEGKIFSSGIDISSAGIFANAGKVANDSYKPLVYI